MLFTETEIRKMESEFERWQEFLNFMLGFFSFNAALACLSLGNPQLYATISFLFFLIAGYSGMNRFPQTYKDLRDKKDRTDLEEVWFLGIKSKFFGLSVFVKKLPVYWFGLLILGLVAGGALKSSGWS